MAGRLDGIARHAAPKGPMETVDHVTVTVAEGVRGDFRGGLASTKAGHKRQVSLIEAESVAEAFAEAHAALDWSDCRRNLLVSGLRLPRAAGARIAIGGSLVIEVTMECDPCDRMDALKDGLRLALTPDWRGGLLGRVVSDGEIAVGDAVRII
ncbi:MOSC domain-containing protein [Croceibacterium aestuarii]|uniref:MOSC domain-containing protein n=1 Tax=Croceibacterium aestuarii TaxID=3064139 RepID=UPI00272E4629|nr:MOSC domain-containing protein [Croceibacterium sp. D39]